jgi:hypothetical protein
VEQNRRSSVYLGPDKNRWTVADWADVIEAAAGGLLDESHYVDLKRELSSGRTHNTDLAEDLASLAIDGGLLVIGIEEKDSRAGKVVGVPLAKLADRVDRVACDKIHPSLVVRSKEVEDPDRPGHGCLLILVPPSPQAPHMVNHVYFGRSDRANYKLSDDDVRRVFNARNQSRSDILADLLEMTEDDRALANQKHSHLYVLAQPEVPNEDALVDFLASRGDARKAMLDIYRGIKQSRPKSDFDPDLDASLTHPAPCADGLTFRNYWNSDGDSEYAYLDLVVREDCGLRLISGRGTDDYTPGVIPRPEKPFRVLFPEIILGLTYSVAALAGALADQYGTYQGQWQLGVRLDKLRGAIAYRDRLWAVGSRVPSFTRDEYQRTTSASTEELVEAPHEVTERLVAPLLRALDIANEYIPYKK